MPLAHEYEKSLNFFLGLTKNNLVNDELIADVPRNTSKLCFFSFNC